jgi:hypothetical protein
VTCLVLDRDGAERVPGAVIEVLDGLIAWADGLEGRRAGVRLTVDAWLRTMLDASGQLALSLRLGLVRTVARFVQSCSTSRRRATGR